MKRDELTSVKKTVFTAICVALCVVLPIAFHAFPNGGSVFSPMHIPALLCGLICGARYGLLCGPCDFWFLKSNIKVAFLKP